MLLFKGASPSPSTTAAVEGETFPGELHRFVGNFLISLPGRRQMHLTDRGPARVSRCRPLQSGKVGRPSPNSPEDTRRLSKREENDGSAPWRCPRDPAKQQWSSWGGGRLMSDHAKIRQDYNVVLSYFCKSMCNNTHTHTHAYTLGKF